MAWRNTIAFVIAISFAGPANSAKYFAIVPSGTVEMLFPWSQKITSSKISSKCMDSRWVIVSSGDNEVTCESPMSFGQSIFGQLALGNSYSTPPRRFFRFVISDSDGVSRVQASGWVELQMAFGQVRRTDFSGAEFQNGIQNWMALAGGQFPLGTTFPNHVMMGVQIVDAPVPNGLGLRITSVAADSPAEKGGLQVGDVIVSIAHKRFKNMDQYLDATAKAAESPAYDVEVLRAGKNITFTLARAFRPSITERVLPKTDVADQTSFPDVSSNVADEIAKLAALRDKGILTTAEFEAQKKKLLGN